MSKIILGALLGSGWYGWIAWMRAESRRRWWEDQAKQRQTDYNELVGKFPSRAAQQEERTNG